MDKKYIIGQANIANDPTAVKFTPQSLTSEQKVQAQTNIGLNDIQLVKTNDLEYTLKVGGIDSGTINIPKDQFLKSVEFNPDTKILTFVFTTSTGDVTTTIDMSALIDVYTAGNGLLLVGNQFSINLDGNSNNSLTISADGLMLDKTQFASTAEFQNLSGQVTDNTAQIETLNSNCVKSPVGVGAFLSEENTLANARPTFKVESKNIVNAKEVTATFAYFPNCTDIEIGENGSYFIAKGKAGPNLGYDSGCIRFFRNTGINTDAGIISYTFDIQLLEEGVNGLSMLSFISDNGKTIASSSKYFDITSDVITISASNIKITGINTNFSIYINNNKVKVSNVQLEYASAPTTYTPFLADGTAVNVKVNNRNLFDFYNAEYQKCTQENGVITISDKSTEALVILPITQLRGKTLTISGDVNNKGNGRVCIQYATATSYIRQDFVDFTTDTHFVKTFTVDNRATVIKLQIPAANADLTTLQSIMMVYGNTEAEYETPVYEAITTAVGQSINITQYDNITNLSVLTEGAVVSGQFILSTQYELNDKLTPLFGTFASRPTTTQPYAILYIATDQTGENKVTILPANTDGSVSGNWISI